MLVSCAPAFLAIGATLIGVLGGPPDGCLRNPPPPACQVLVASIHKTLQEEQVHWVSNVSTDPFYQSPSTLYSYKPGDLIHIERPAENLYHTDHPVSVPPGLSVYRILYLSTDIEGYPVPASAFVLLPYSNNRNPLQIIAWAHGTVGIARHCAPSNWDDLYYAYEAPFSMALQGFAVVATDYAGLGTNATFNYLASSSHAADVVYSVEAARTAFPKILSENWVVVGHSEGGLTAWATNEREVQNPSTGFLGAVAIAPAFAGLTILQININKANGDLSGFELYPAYTLTAMARLDKTIDLNKYFSKVGLERMDFASAGCFNTGLASFTNLTFADMFKDQSWLHASFAEAWQNRTGVRGNKKLAKPMLVIEGVADSSVPTSTIEDAFNLQCKTYPDADIHLSKYPDMDHDPVAFASQVEYLDWIRDRFNGKRSTKCSNGTIGRVNPKQQFVGQCPSMR